MSDEKQFPNFKTKPIGKTTPEVLLTQASELKWKNVVIVGLLENGQIAISCTPQQNPMEITFLLNRFAKLTNMVVESQLEKLVP